MKNNTHPHASAPAQGFRPQALALGPRLGPGVHAYQMQPLTHPRRTVKGADQLIHVVSGASLANGMSRLQLLSAAC